MLTSKKTSLIILVITSFVCSRAWFSFLDDPEGPNLLIVTVLAAILYFIAWALYSFTPSITGVKKLLLAILAQIVVVVALYLFLS